MCDYITPFIKIFKEFKDYYITKEMKKAKEICYIVLWYTRSLLSGECIGEKVGEEILPTLVHQISLFMFSQEY